MRITDEEEIMSGTDYEVAIPIKPTEATRLEAEGFKIASKVQPSLMSEQLRKELIRIVTEGDGKNGGAFTIAVATHVEKFVAAAREILMTEKLAQNDVSALLAMRRKRNFLGGAYLGSPDEALGDDGTGAIYGAPTNENFGIQAIRQMIEAAQSMHNSPARLVEALAAAKSHGLDDVAAEIERKLGVSTPALAADPAAAETAGAQGPTRSHEPPGPVGAVEGSR